MESRCSCVEGSTCDFCRFSAAFSFPLPGEVFARSTLTLQHQGGLCISFNAFDALRAVDAAEAGVTVAYAADWLAARPGSRALEAVRPYDWTFTSSYRGTLSPAHQPQPTAERIDLESLKAQEKILFYDDVYLFADDFSDNGMCSMNARVRVMPSGFFVLLRQFIRVDRVMVRMRDTRLHHRFGWPHVLREYCESESSVAELLEHLRPLGLDERALFQPEKIPVVAEKLNVRKVESDSILLAASS